MNKRVQPSSGFDVIQASNNNLKLSIEIVILFLDFTNVGSDLAARNSFHDEIGSYLTFVFTNILHSEKELSVQVSEINGIQINDVNVLHTRKSQILQYFAT